MTSQILLYIIIAILVIDFIFETALELANIKNLKTQLPDRLNDIYDSEKYKTSQEYTKETTRFGLLSGSISLIATILMLCLGGFAFIDSLAGQITNISILRALIFFGIIMFGSDLISLPFSIYSIFVIEEKYGFNKTTPAIFVFDKIKGWLISGVIGGVLLSAIMWFYTIAGSWFWIYAWILVTLFSIFISMFYSSLIVPLFNKQTPLEEGELRTEIETFSKANGFKLNNIYEIDGSKRSTKANAYFSGLGTKKRIVLFDTLIKEATVSEIVAVLAHEIGHYQKKHTLIGLVMGIIQTGLILFIFSLFVKSALLSQALGASEHSFQLALISFGILFTPINFILGIFGNILSRKNEFEADRFAKETASSDNLISALKKLSAKNLSNLTPHPAYVFFHYSHPPLLQRIEALDK